MEEEALQLRDKIYLTAPDSMKERTDNKWVIALLSAKAYFNTEAESGEAEYIWFYPYLHRVSNRQVIEIYTLFKGGFSIREIANIINCKVDEVTSTLRNRWSVTESTNTIQDVGASPIEDIVSISTIQSKLRDGVGVGDIAAEFGVSIADILFLLHNKSDKQIDRYPLYTGVIQEWMSGKSIAFIADKFKASVETIESNLNLYGYATMGKMSTIKIVNKVITEDKTVSEFKPSTVYRYKPDEPYKALAPMLDCTDFDNMNSYRILGQGDLVSYIGYKNIEKLRSNVVRENIKGFLMEVCI